MSLAVDPTTNKSEPSSSSRGQLSGRSRLGRLTGIEIMATGSYVPETVVANDDLADLGCDSDWIVQRTGIRERRRASPEQATSDLALRAAQQCLERAGVSADEIDLIVVATITPDQASPSTSMPPALVSCTRWSRPDSLWSTAPQNVRWLWGRRL